MRTSFIYFSFHFDLATTDLPNLFFKLYEWYGLKEHINDMDTNEHNYIDTLYPVSILLDYQYLYISVRAPVKYKLIIKCNLSNRLSDINF